MRNNPNTPYDPYGAYQSPNNPPPQWPAPGSGQGAYNSPDQNAPTEPFDLPDQYPPPYTPAGPQYPTARPPQWPDHNVGPGYTASNTQRVSPSQPYTDLRGAPGYTGVHNARPAYGVPASVERQHASAAPQRQAHALPHLPVAHLLLILGVGALAFALTQPWGVDAQGGAVYIQSFNSSTLTQFGIDLGSAAFQTASDLVIATGALSLALILTNSITLIINKLLGLIGLSGLASLVFVPLLWGMAALLLLVLAGDAGFGGFDTLSQLPIIRDHGIAGVNVAQHAIGFYLWWGGVFATFMGMLGQLALRRR